MRFQAPVAATAAQVKLSTRGRVASAVANRSVSTSPSQDQCGARPKAAEPPTRQDDYADCWKGLKKHFNRKQRKPT